MTATTTHPAAGTVPAAAPGHVRLGHLVGAVGGGDDAAAHLRGYGPLPGLSGRDHLPGLLSEAGLTGRGGAAFPTARKLATVAASRGPTVVVGNASEGEPAAHKDATLLRVAPHLVLDGLQLAAAAVHARRVVLYLHRDPRQAERLARLAADRRRIGLDHRPVEIVAAPHRFLAGEESALASRVSGGLALPRFTPPRVFQSGVDGRPTLVQNVETLAQVALVARFGPAWFRSVGTAAEPGTMLTTVHSRSGWRVSEAALGTPLTTVLGDPLEPAGTTSAILVGGYHGAWLPAAAARDLRLANEDLRPHGAALGAGVLAALPADRCGLVETARVVRYLAGESAGQCGPCLNGLPAIANGLSDLAARRAHPGVVDRLSHWSGLVEGRGACHHPDGTVRLVRSALVAFAEEIDRHEQGRCSATDHSPLLPVPADAPLTDDDWR